MNRDNRSFRVVATALICCCLHAFAQQPSRSFGPNGSAQGELTVTGTVVSSVSVVIGQNGEQRLIIANAVDDRDNASSLQPVVSERLTPVARAQRGSQMPEKKKSQSNQSR